VSFSYELRANSRAARRGCKLSEFKLKDTLDQSSSGVFRPGVLPVELQTKDFTDEIVASIQGIEETPFRTSGYDYLHKN
jgi:hypothetical protein